jgi:glucose/arabinose dehydrogenase
VNRAHRRRRLGRWLSLVVVVLGLWLAGLGPAPQAVAAVLPAGFTDELIASVGSPTALAFTPDGRLLVTTQGGLLRAYTPGTFALIRNALNLGPILCSNEERGLLGVAVDPQFASNHYIYLYYSFKKGGICPDGDVLNPDNPVNRVARFVLQDDSRVLTPTETVLVDNIPTVDGDHNGGDLKFGKDGYLYVSIGDNDCNYEGGPCGGGNEASRDEHILLGKILRITRDGGIPPGNPFTGAGSDRCNVTGRTTPGRRCQETFAWGLRNPFRMAFDPNAAGTRFFINDVGQRAREEIDLGQAGADYGWNCREGTLTNSTSGKCSPTPPNLVDPIYEYGRGSGCAAITGGAFVPNGVWPAQYNGQYLFSDYVCGSLFQLAPAAGGTYTATVFASGLGANSAVALAFGPFGGSQALYYTTYAGGGQVRRLAYSQAPVADIAANPTSGSVPLTVAFSGAGSTNPGGGPLTYDWTFGDGATLPGQSAASASHTYTANGVYTATLVVRNSGGLASSPARVTIAAGNTPPTPTILQPAQGATFTVGQVINLQGQASDAQDGTLPGTALDWEVRLHHVDIDSPGTAHWHPHASASGTASASFTAPAPEDLGATALSYVEVILRATDSGGLQAEVSRTLQPRRVEATFATTPAGLNLVVNAQTITTTRTLVTWTNWTIGLEAPALQFGGPTGGYQFQSWSNGGSRAQTITLPATATTYTASYAQAAPGVIIRLFAPLVLR